MEKSKVIKLKKGTKILAVFLLLLLIFSGCTPFREKSKSRKIEVSPSKKTPTQEVSKKGTAKVVSVTDADTIVVLLKKGQREKVRLIGIDAPERGKPYFEKTVKETKNFVLGKDVRLERDVSERDKKGRLLRYVFVGDFFLNAELIKQGYAEVHISPPDIKYKDLFLKLEKEAKEAHRGRWWVLP